MSKASLQNRLQQARKIRAKIVAKTDDPHCSCSSIDRFLSCRRGCYYYLVRCLKPKVEPAHFSEGTAWHNALDYYYTFGTIKAGLKSLTDHYKEKRKERGLTNITIDKLREQEAMLRGMFKGYIQTLGKKDRKDWNFVKCEKSFSIPQFLGSSLSFQGRIDCVIEIKSGKNIASTHW